MGDLDPRAAAPEQDREPLPRAAHQVVLVCWLMLKRKVWSLKNPVQMVMMVRTVCQLISLVVMVWFMLVTGLSAVVTALTVSRKVTRTCSVTIRTTTVVRVLVGTVTAWPLRSRGMA